MSVDLIDRQILMHMQRDGALSVSQIADLIGMTPPPCWRRIRRLKDAGLLVKRVWQLDAEALGFGVSIFAFVKLSSHDKDATTAFRERVLEIPQIQECFILLGSVDALLKIVASTVGEYEKFFYDVLSQIPGVHEVTSSVVMSATKSTSELPLIS